MIASSDEFRVIVAEYVDSGTRNIGRLEETAAVDMCLNAGSSHFPVA